MLDKKSLFWKILWAIILALPAGVIQYFMREVLEAWGVLTPIAAVVGTWLGTNITAEQVGWTIALTVAFALYVIGLMVIWRNKSEAVEREIIDTNETVAACEAIRLLADARPNSDDTTAVRLRDKARMGAVRSWGRPIPKDVIVLHIPTVEQIPPDVWSYAEIDTSVIRGSLSVSRLRYIRRGGDDDRALYDAVRFNKKEITELCRAESI